MSKRIWNDEMIRGDEKRPTTVSKYVSAIAKDRIPGLEKEDLDQILLSRGVKNPMEEHLPLPFTRAQYILPSLVSS